MKKLLATVVALLLALNMCGFTAAAATVSQPSAAPESAAEQLPDLEAWLRQQLSAATGDAAAPTPISIPGDVRLSAPIVVARPDDAAAHVVLAGSGTVAGADGIGALFTVPAGSSLALDGVRLEGDVEVDGTLTLYGGAAVAGQILVRQGGALNMNGGAVDSLRSQGSVTLSGAPQVGGAAGAGLICGEGRGSLALESIQPGAAIHLALPDTTPLPALLATAAGGLADQDMAALAACILPGRADAQVAAEDGALWLRPAAEGGQEQAPAIHTQNGDEAPAEEGPTATLTQPENGATVKAYGVLKVTFSEAMNRNSGTVELRAMVDGEPLVETIASPQDIGSYFDYSNTTLAAPFTDLAFPVEWTVYLTGFETQQGTALADGAIGSFTTTAPTASLRQPAAGATGVTPDSGRVCLKFSESMNIDKGTLRLQAVVDGQTITKTIASPLNIRSFFSLLDDEGKGPDYSYLTASYYSLDYGTEWGVYIEGFETARGVPLADGLVGSFTTRAKPTITAITLTSDPAVLTLGANTFTVTAQLSGQGDLSDCKLTFLLSHPGGTRSASATTNAEGLASVTYEDIEYQGEDLRVVVTPSRHDISADLLLGSAKTTVTIEGLTAEDGRFQGYSTPGPKGYTGTPVFKANGVDVTDDIGEDALSILYTGADWEGRAYGSSVPPVLPGRYSVALLLDGDSTYRGSLILNYTIGKGVPKPTVPKHLWSTYGQTLADVDLDDDHFAWKYPDTDVGPVTDGTDNPMLEHPAIYTPSDTNLYEVTEYMLPVGVGRPMLTVKDITFAPKIFNGSTEAQVEQVTFNNLRKGEQLTRADYTITAHYPSPYIKWAGTTISYTLTLNDTPTASNYVFLFNEGTHESPAMQKAPASAADLVFSAENAVYDGLPHGGRAAPAEGLAGYGFVVPKYRGTGYPESVTPPTNAGTYTMLADITEGHNHAAGQVELTTFTIEKAPMDKLTPVIHGTARVGSPLSATMPAAEGCAFEWQWYRDGAPIAGATAAGYTPAQADLGARLTVQATTGSNHTGPSGYSTAAAVAPALAAKACGFEKPTLAFAFEKNQTQTVALAPGHDDTWTLQGYTSSSTGIFTVQKLQDGRQISITLKGIGTANLTGKWTKDGKTVTDAVTVQVATTAPIKLALNKSNTAAAPLKLDAGKTQQLTVKNKTSKLVIADVKWTSSDETVARVDHTGKVTAVAPGAALITATATDTHPDSRTASVSCAFQVLRPATAVRMEAVDYLALEDIPRLVLQKYVDERNLGTVQLTAVAEPFDCTDQIKWTTSNDKIAKVGNGTTSGKTVTLVAGQPVTVTTGSTVGNVTITAQAGSVKATYKFKPVIPAAGVIINSHRKETMVEQDIGEQKAISATVYAKDGKKATDQRVIWESLDPHTASITQKGLVTCVGPGSTLINAYAADDPEIEPGWIPFYCYRVVNTIRFTEKSFTVAHSEDPDNPTRVLIGAVLNNGLGLMRQYGGIKLTIPNTKGFELMTAPTNPYDEQWHQPNKDNDYGKLAFLDSDAYSTRGVYLILKHLEPGKKVTTRITAVSAMRENIRCHIDVTVTSEGVATAGGLRFENEAAAPGTAPQTQLAAGKSFTPKVTFTDSQGQPLEADQAPGNPNLKWDITAETQGGDEAIATAYVHFNRATGGVTGRWSSLEDDVVLTVTGTPMQAGLPTVSYSFMVKQPATSLTVQPAGAAGTGKIERGATTRLQALVQPGDVTDGAVVWSTDEPEIVALSTDAATAQPVTVTGLKPGTATVTATAADGSGVSAGYKLTVTQAVMDAIITTQAQKDDGSLGEYDLPRGATKKLAHKLNAGTVEKGTAIEPANTAPAVKGVRWVVVAEYSASLPNTPAPAGSVVTLNTRTGQVKGISAGYALIRVVPANDDGSFESTGVTVHTKSKTGAITSKRYANTLRVNVVSKPSTIRLEQGSFKVHSPVGAPAAFTLNATTSPTGAGLSTGQDTLTWTIADTRAYDFDPAAITDAACLTRSGNKAEYVDTSGTGQMRFIAKELESGSRASKLTVKATSGKTASITITAYAALSGAPAPLSLQPAKPNVTLKAGSSTTLKTSFNPTSTGNKNLRWAIEEAFDAAGNPVDAASRDTIAVIDGKTGKLTARGSGRVVVVATSLADETLHASFSVVCLPKV